MSATEIKYDAQGAVFTDEDGDSVEVGLDLTDCVFVGVNMGGDYEGAYLDRDAVVELRQLLDGWLDEKPKAVMWADYKAGPLPESFGTGVAHINTETGETLAELFPPLPDLSDMHMGRSFSGHWLEDECPCPQEACGLVRWDRAVPECDQHGLGSTQTIRQGHQDDKCPGAAE